MLCLLDKLTESTYPLEHTATCFCNYKMFVGTLSLHNSHAKAFLQPTSSRNWTSMVKPCQFMSSFSNISDTGVFRCSLLSLTPMLIRLWHHVAMLGPQPVLARSMATAKRSMSSGGPEGNVVGNAARSTTPRREDMAAETHAPRSSWPKSWSETFGNTQR